MKLYVYIYILLRVNLKVPIATVVTLVKRQDRQSFASTCKVGYVDQHITTGRDAVRFVISTASLTILLRCCGSSRNH
jgi:hypothetical protein